MTGAEHYAKAQELLAAVSLDESGLPKAGRGLDIYVAAAQVHATLALASATALPPSQMTNQPRTISAWCDAERES